MEIFSLIVLVIVMYSSNTTGHYFIIHKPIVKKSNMDSYFGYSVAQYEFDNKIWILVGAPLDKHDNETRGSLLKCPMTYMKENDCERVPIKNMPNHNPDEVFEYTIDPWFGVTVRANKNKIIFCGHRYAYKPTAYSSIKFQGKCYILSNNFKTQYALKPCLATALSIRHGDWNHCQGGVSATFGSSDIVYMGSPGWSNWRGNVYYSDTNENEMNLHPVLPEKTSQDFYSYLGMSVVLGNFLGKGEYVAMGAPNSNTAGQVFLHSGNHILKINGEQLGSGFGYEMIKADIDCDDKDDLIIAAPFYFDESNGGGVYVYMKMHKNCDTTAQTCNVTSKLVGRRESRFGFAMTNLGDINENTYEDIAIGAPYEESGVVYIYTGSERGIFEPPSQIIRGKDHSFLPRFGYSLGSGSNHASGFNLIVGTHESDTVYLFMSRRVLSIENFLVVNSKNEIDKIDPGKKGCLAKENSNQVCYTLKLCIQTNCDDFVLDLQYYIEAETYSGETKSSRVYFSENSKNYINRTMMRVVDGTYCQNHTIYLKDHIRDILSPIKFRVNYTLIQDESKIFSVSENGVPDVSKVLALDQESSTYDFEIEFVLDCGDDNVCESKLQVTAAFDQCVLSLGSNHCQIFMEGRQELIIMINVLNKGESAHQTRLFVIHPPRLNYIQSTSNDHVQCQPIKKDFISCYVSTVLRAGKSAQVKIRFDPKYLEDDKSQLNFIVYANTTSNDVGMQTPTQLNVTISKFAELSIHGKTKPLQLSHKPKVKSNEEYIQQLFQNYTIYNDGPWGVNTINVSIFWPYGIIDLNNYGKWHLEVDKAPEILSVGKSFCQNKTMDNPINWNVDGNLTTTPLINCQTEGLKCLVFECTIFTLPKKREVKISIQGRLWNSTFVNMSKIDTMRIVSYAEIIAPNVKQKQLNDDHTQVITVLYGNWLDEHIKEEVPLWIILLTVLLGLLILAIISYVLHKCGFFKRHRPEETHTGNLEQSNDNN